MHQVVHCYYQIESAAERSPHQRKMFGGETTVNERSPLRRVLLGWPALFVVWAYALWLGSRLVQHLTVPVHHSGASNIDATWMTTLLPAMYVPTLVVFAYCNWLGWKFFQHN